MGVFGRITEIKWIENIDNNNETDIDDRVRNKGNASSDNNDSSSKNKNIKKRIKKEKSWTKVTFESKNSRGIISSSTESLFQSKRYQDKKQKKMKYEEDAGRQIRENEGKGQAVILVGKILTLRIQLDQIVYPFSGYLAVSISVTNHRANRKFNKNNGIYHENDNENEKGSKSKSKNHKYETGSDSEDDSHLYSEITDFIGDVDGRLLVTVETPGTSRFTSDLSHSDKNRFEKERLRGDNNSSNNYSSNNYSSNNYSSNNYSSNNYSSNNYSSNNNDSSNNYSNNNDSNNNSSNSNNTDISISRKLIDDNNLTKQNISDRNKNYNSSINPINGNISINVLKIDQNNNGSLNSDGSEKKPMDRYSLQDTPDEIIRKQQRIKKDKSHPRSSSYNPIGNVQISVASADATIRVEKTPPREKRLLWDVYHDIGYPSAYVPRDDLSSSRLVSNPACLRIPNLRVI